MNNRKTLAVMPSNPKKEKTCENGHRFFKSSDCPVCPVCEANRKQKSHFLSVLAAPARRALESKGINSLEALSAFTETELLKLHGLGKSSIPKIQAMLKTQGLTLKDQ